MREGRDTAAIVNESNNARQPINQLTFLKARFQWRQFKVCLINLEFEQNFYICTARLNRILDSTDNS